MTRYISILRGVNVGGKRKILMADLKALYVKLEFSNIKNYIQSGNIIFDSNEKEGQKEFCQKIGHAIRKVYGFDVPIIVRTVQEFENTIVLKCKNQSINLFCKLFLH